MVAVAKRVHLLVPSSWLSMLVTWMLLLLSSHGENSVDTEASGIQCKNALHLSLLVFVLSYGVFCSVHWYLERKVAVAHIARAIPSNVSMDYSTGCWYRSGSQLSSEQLLDEAKWYNWTCSEAMEWIAQVLKNSALLDSPEQLAPTLALLIPHRIQGDVLDTLNTDCLVNILHLPYTPAHRLATTIQHLTLAHPKPRPTTTSFAHDTAPINFLSTSYEFDALAMHDREYNQQNIYSQFAPFASASTPPQPPQMDSHPTESNIAMEQEQGERMNQIMKDRFGMELPQLATVSGHPATASSIPSCSISQSGDHHLSTQPPKMEHVATPQVRHGPRPPGGEHLPEQNSRNMHDYSNSYDSQEYHDVKSSSPLPPSILENMPPQIRDIVSRRPDLVRKILTEK
eukprot:Nitzschia sp. Nitz4//scaffold191_size41780//14123//15319//NITZ4_007465-RA/size41780-processed-gene-0.44-mRNA-1//-1//CDS//3329540175//2938//frame0